MTRNGTVALGRHYLIGVGSDWAGRSLTVVHFGRRVVVLDGATLVRRLTLDVNRRYQPTGLPTARRP